MQDEPRSTVDAGTSRERARVRHSLAARTAHGSPQLFLGLGVLVVLVGVALIVGLFPAGGGDGGVARLVGFVVVATGAYLAWNGMTTAARAGSRAATPWRADGFATPVLTDEVGQPQALMVLQAAVALGFGAVLVERAGAGGNARYLGFAFLLAGAGVLGYMLWNQVRRWKFGHRKLLVRHLPTPPGQTLELVFQGGPKLGGTDVRAVLQCVEQEHHVRFSQNRNSVPSFRIYQEERRHRTDARGEASLAFEIPGDLPGTRLRVGSNESAIYWRLQVEADVQGLDYEGEFLLPVYAR